MSTPTPPPPPNLTPVPLGSEPDARHDTGEMPVIKSQLHRELNVASLKIFGAFIVAIVVGTVGVYSWVDAHAESRAREVVAPIAQQQKNDREAADAAVADFSTRLTRMEQRFDRLEDRTDKKLDGLYQLIKTGQPQPVFEKKPDGGTP